MQFVDNQTIAFLNLIASFLAMTLKSEILRCGNHVIFLKNTVTYLRGNIHTFAPSIDNHYHLIYFQSYFKTTHHYNGQLTLYRRRDSHYFLGYRIFRVQRGRHHPHFASHCNNCDYFTRYSRQITRLGRISNF